MNARRLSGVFTFEVPVLILIPAIVLALASQAKSTDAPVSLGRVFTPHEKLTYAVRSSLSAEQRGGGLTTWIPEDLDINYDFTVEVQQLKADGIAIVHYKRPTMTQIQGETFEETPKPKVEKVNFDFQLTVSPFNEILETKDLVVKKKPPVKKGVLVPGYGAPQGSLQAFIGQFVGELYRLCLFTGPMDSALDFAPRSTFDDVKVGDTWQRTVGYQPQKLKGKKDQAVQRLDYTYTYKGMVNGEKGKVLRVEAKLNFNTDLGDFIKQLSGATADQIGLDKVPMKLDAVILFDLDPKTKHTLKAEATSQAGVQFFEPGKTDPAEELRMKGHTNMRLVSRTFVKPVAAKKK